MESNITPDRASLCRCDVRVVYLVRSVGPTSMPWNDLYSTMQRIAPGLTYPPVVVDFAIKKSALRWTDCRNKQRRYLSANPVTGLW
jgi:hypothetical protein